MKNEYRLNGIYRSQVVEMQLVVMTLCERVSERMLYFTRFLLIPSNIEE